MNHGYSQSSWSEASLAREALRTAICWPGEAGDRPCPAPTYTASFFCLAGTTCLIALLSDKDLTVANVGDSRGVLCDKDGNAIPLSHDHKPYQLKERKRIKRAGEFVTPTTTTTTLGKSTILFGDLGACLESFSGANFTQQSHSVAQASPVLLPPPPKSFSARHGSIK